MHIEELSDVFRGVADTASSTARALIRRVNQVDRRPGVFYFHPWEIDPAQPRVPGTGVKTRFRHYVNLRRTQPRLRRLLRDFRWSRMDEVFLDPAAAGAPQHAQQATVRFAS